MEHSSGWHSRVSMTAVGSEQYACTGGRRLVRQWICRPLRDVAAINGRLDAVQELIKRPELVVPLRSALEGELYHATLAEIDQGSMSTKVGQSDEKYPLERRYDGQQGCRTWSEHSAA